LEANSLWQGDEKITKGFETVRRKSSRGEKLDLYSTLYRYTTIGMASGQKPEILSCGVERINLRTYERFSLDIVLYDTSIRVLLLVARKWGSQ